MLAGLREEVLAANLGLVEHGLVTLTWGNASGIDRASNLVAIKASGVPYEGLTAQDIVLVDLDGHVAWGERRPSTDTPTHLALYRAFSDIGGVVHTHSPWATAWAQAQREIPLLGTTHADLCAAPIPLARPLTEAEIAAGYEQATGEALVDAVGSRGARLVPCALVRGHGPFCWGDTPAAALEHAVTLEQVARMAHLTMALAAEGTVLDRTVADKHFARKHGPSAYYGQG